MRITRSCNFEIARIGVWTSTNGGGQLVKLIQSERFRHSERSRAVEEIRKDVQSIKFENEDNALVQLRDRPDWCMDLSFMMGLLHTGGKL
jgi:hypothetical protein